MKETHDSKLGRELRGLPVHDHDEGYWSRLERELSPASLETARGSRPRRKWFYLAAAAAAALALALSLIFAGIPGVRHSAPQTATAAEVSRAIDAGMASARTFRGDFTWTNGSKPGGTTVDRGTFATTARGDSRVSSTPVSDTWKPPVEVRGTSITAYNAVTHLVTEVMIAPSGRKTFHVARNAATDLPLLFPGQSMLTEYRAQASALRALLAEKNPGLVIEKTTFEGRPVWRTSVTGHGRENNLAGKAVAATYHTEVVVDRQTGFVLLTHSTETLANGEVPVDDQLVLSNVQVNAPLPSGLFTIAVPAHTAVDPMMQLMAPVHSVALDKVAALVGWVPLVPHALPQGYRLETVALIPLGANSRPARNTLVLLGYRRGFDRILIMLYDGSRHGWSAGTLPLQPDWLRKTRLTRGAFAGNVATTLFGLFESPTMGVQLVASTPQGLLVQISGDLTRAQLLAVANSLEPYRRH